ncbi:MAG: phage baseplate protein [Bacilli bacterium]
MAQSIKLKNDKYLDSSSITHNQKKLCDILYPIGSIYMSAQSTSPETLFGGKWERLKGGFLYGAVNSYGTGNGTGTSTNTHKLTIDETPAHEHTLRYNSSSGNGVTISRAGSGYDVLNLTEWEWTVGDVRSNLYTNSVGGNEGHSHNIPYIAVFIWRRTA